VVAGVVCCAACSAGDMSQDLKTGHLIGASPRAQQWAQIVSVIIPAFVLAPTMSLLHSAYGIGNKLQAPQATLFASITKGIFEKGSLPKSMIVTGMILGVLIILADEILKRKKSHFRLHVMPLAVGIYLPMSLSVPIFFGGVIRWLCDKRRGITKTDSPESERDEGVLLSSGLIAGEAIMGILLAIPVYFGLKLQIPLQGTEMENILMELATLLSMTLVVIMLERSAFKNKVSGEPR
jgi:putative OPT family oligopeptide transporter